MPDDFFNDTVRHFSLRVGRTGGVATYIRALQVCIIGTLNVNEVSMQLESGLHSVFRPTSTGRSNDIHKPTTQLHIDNNKFMYLARPGS